MEQIRLSNLLLNQSKDLFWIVDLNFQLIYANTKYLNLMKEIIGVEKKLNESVFVDGFGEGHIEKWKAYYNRALKGEYFEIDEHFYNTQLNEIQYSQVSFEPLTGEDNRFFAVACQSKNISQIAKQWSEANELIDASLDVFCTVNELGNFEFVSAASANHWGYLPEELIGKAYVSFILEEDVPKTNEIAAAIFAGQEIKSFVNRYRRKDGGIAYNVWSSRWDTETKLMYCVARDGKEKIEQEEKIQQSELRFKALVQDGSDLIAIINTEGIYSYVSPTSTAILGITPEEFIGKSAFDFIHPDDVEKTVAALQKISSEDKMTVEPFRFRNHKGEWRWIETVLTNMLHNPAVNGIVANSRDITEKVNALKQIEANELFNRTVLESSPDCLKILDTEGRLQFMNYNGLCQMEIDDFGNLKNRAWWTLWGSENEALVKATLAKALTGETAQFIALCPTAKGTPKWWDVMVSPVGKPGEIVQQIISVSRDITAQKNKELENELLANISKIFHAANDYINAANGVCKSISEYGNFDLVEVWTSNIEKSQMRLLTHYVANKQDEEFYGDSTVGNVYKISESLVGKVWSQKMQLIWDDIGNNKDFVRRIAAKKIGLKAVLGIPLIFNDEAVGVLKIGTKQDADYLKKCAPLLTHLEKHIGSELNRKKLENDLTHLYDAIPDIIGVGDFEGRVLKINKACCELLGYPEDEIVYRSFNDFVHPDDIDIVTNEFKNLGSGQLTLRFEIRFITKCGSIVWLSWQCNPSVKEGVVYFTAKNITEEKKLRELNRQTNSLAKIGSWEVDLVNQSLFWSEEVYKMHETDSRSFTPNLQSAINFYREDFRPMVQQIIPKSISTGEPFDFEAVLVTAKKKEIWVRVIGDTEMVDGVCKRIYGSFQDINSLKETENRLLSLSENLPGVVYQYIIHPDGTEAMDFISGAVEQLWGYSTYEVMENINLLWNQIKLGGDFEEVKASIYKSIQTKSKWKSRFKIVKPNGELKTHLGNSGVPVFLADGRIVFNVIVLDITNEAKNEDLLEQVTKLAKIGSWEMNIPQNSRHWSDMMYSILETDSSQYIPEAESLINFYREDFRALAQSALLACMEKSIPIDFEAIMVTALKNEKWVRVLGNIEMIDGKPNRIYGSMQDIDGRKKTEEKLFDSEQKYRLINVHLQLQQLHLTNAQQVAKVGSWETDLSTFKVTWSDETFRIFGINKVGFNATHENFLSYIHPLDKDKVEKAFSESITAPALAQNLIEHRIVTPKGDVKVVEERWKITHNDKGEPLLAIGSCQDITERKKAEEDIIDSEEKRRLIMNGALDAIISINTKGIITFWNPQAELIFGWKEAEAMGKQLSELIIPAAYRKQHDEGLKNYLKTGKGNILNVLLELSAIRHNGEEFPIELTIIPIKQAGEEFFCAFIRDITQRKEAEREKNDLQLTLENSLNEIYIFDNETFKFSYVNKGALYNLGYSKNEIETLTPLDLKPDFTVASFKSLVSPLTKNEKKEIIFFTSHKRKNGTLYPVEVHLQLVSVGNKKRFVAIILDITERKKAEEEIKFKANLLNTIGQAAIATNLEGIVNYWNQAAEDIYGWSLQEAIGQNIVKLTTPEPSKEQAMQIMELLKKGQTWSGNFKVRKKDGTEFMALVSNSPVYDDHNILSGIIGVSIDISEKIKNEKLLELYTKELENSNERFEKVTEATNDVIWDWDIINQVYYRSNAIERFFGKRALKLMTGEDLWVERFHSEDLEMIQKSVEAAIANPLQDRWELEYRVIHENEKIIYVIDRGVIIRNKEGKAIRMVGAMTDISEQKQMSIQLSELNESLKQYTLELERSNEELEQFAFVASHDLQEPLRMVSSFMDQLKRKYGDLLDEKGLQYIYFAADGAKRMKQIILDLLQYSRASRHTEGKEAIDMNELVAEFKQLRRKVISEKKASIKARKLPILHTYKAAITQIMHCLLDNAIKYTAEGTSPIIQIDVVEHEKEWEFSIKDNGIGVQPQFYNKIFVIFQRLHNKDEYAGTGIGLSIAKRHVEFLGGRIWLQSAPDAGTVFYFTIPKVE